MANEKFKPKQKLDLSDPATRDYALGMSYLTGNPPLIPKDEKTGTQFLLKAAKAGHPQAQCAFAHSCATGRGIAQDYVQAAYWFEQAAKKNVVEAQVNLATILWKGLAGAKDEKRAFSYFIKLTQQKEPPVPMAMCAVGEMYKTGSGVDQNSVAAVTWLEEAFNHGEVEAAYHLGEMYERGYPGCERNRQTAKAWYEKAAPQVKWAAFRLGVLCEEDNELKRAVDLFEQASQGSESEPGIPQATFLLALAYEKGKGTPKDAKKAAQLYKKAAAKGEAMAAYNVGNMLLYAEGITQNKLEGIKYFLQAAEQGAAAAFFVLGIFHQNGEAKSILAHDKEKAIQCFEIVCERKKEVAAIIVAEAALRLAGIYSKRIPTLVDLAQAEADAKKVFTYYQLAAEQGNAEGAYQLAICYANSIGTSRDGRQCAEWLQKAQQGGSVKAFSALGHIHEVGLGVQRDQAKAIKYYQLGASQEDADSAFALGRSYLFGEGVSKDSRLAAQSFLVAAQQGHAEAAFILWKMYAAGLRASDKQTLWDWLITAANKGNPQAAFAVGVAYLKGDGLKTDVAVAMDWFKKAVDKRYAPAAFMLGVFLEDISKAERYLRLTAAEGGPRGFLWLACLLRERDPELSHYLVLGSSLPPTEKLERTPYVLLKRFAEVRQFMKLRETGEHARKLDKIYDALEATFDLLAQANNRQQAAVQVRSNIHQLEIDLQLMEQVKAQWEKIETAARAKFQASLNKDSGSAEVKDTASSQQCIPDSPDTIFDDLIPLPFFATQEKVQPKIAIVLDEELKLLRRALLESAELAKESPTVDKLTDRREGLLSIMSRILRRIAKQQENPLFNVFVNDFHAMQKASNYMGHDESLVSEITEASSKHVVTVASIHTAAEKLIGYLEPRLKAIEPGAKESKATSKTSFIELDPFSTKAATTRPKSFKLGAQIKYYKKVSPHISKRSESVLQNERYIRLLGLTENACAQIKKDRKNRSRYRAQGLQDLHNNIQMAGWWNRHPGEITLSELKKYVMDVVQTPVAESKTIAGPIASPQLPGWSMAEAARVSGGSPLHNHAGAPLAQAMVNNTGNVQLASSIP